MIYEQSAFLDSGFRPGKGILLKAVPTVMILAENYEFTTTSLTYVGEID